METKEITKPTPVEVNIGLLPEWQQEDLKTRHLQAWINENTPADNMKYKDAAVEQLVFIRDLFAGMFVDFLEKIEVISTHTSKSIKLPVYYVKFKDGTTLIIRDNFHDLKVSVNSIWKLN